MRIPVSQIEKFKEAPRKESMKDWFLNNSCIWGRSHRHGGDVWSSSWRVIRGSAGKTRSEIRSSLLKKVNYAGAATVDYVMRRYIDELTLIDGKKHLIGTYGGPIELPKYSKWRHECYFENNVLKIIPTKPHKRRRGKPYYREHDPVLRALYDAYYSLRIYKGEKWVSTSVKRYVKSIKRTLHYPSGGIHTIAKPVYETHYKTVTTSIWVSVSKEEYMQHHIALLEDSYYNACTKNEQNSIKEKLDKYRYIYENKWW